MKLDDLIERTSPDVRVGVGLVEGDIREPDVLYRVDFCPIAVFRGAGHLLGALEKGEIDAAVRGSLPSEEFLRRLRKEKKRAKVRRIALLNLPEGKSFLLAPVGIDEGRTAAEAKELLGDCRDFCSLLGWEPRIGVLSAGRREDRGRGRDIRRSIRRGEKLAAAGGVRNFYISVEDAACWANCVVAPDGITGNLMYRTLTRLGWGSSLGALYFPLRLGLADTSRSGSVEEYLGAIALSNISRTHDRGILQGRI